MRSSRVALLLLLAASRFAVARADELKPATPVLPMTDGSPPKVALEVVGPEANPDKLERCRESAKELGVLVDPAAPVSVVLHLADNANELRVTRRGKPTAKQARPGWGMSALCKDALAFGLRAVDDEWREKEAASRARPTPPPVVIGPSSTPPPKTPPTPEAQAQAKQLHGIAAQAFNDTRYDLAIDSWTQAYELDHHPAHQFNLGRAYQKRGEKLGHIADLKLARQFYRRFVDLAPKAKFEAKVIKILDDKIREMEEDTVK